MFILPCDILQLRDDVADEGDDRSTHATLERLEANGSLETSDYEALSRGYELLRAPITI